MKLITLYSTLKKTKEKLYGVRTITSKTIIPNRVGKTGLENVKYKNDLSCKPLLFEPRPPPPIQDGRHPVQEYGYNEDTGEPVHVEVSKNQLITYDFAL
jgi:hypothetical protein